MRTRKLQERDGASPADKSPLSSRGQFGEVIQEPCNRSFAQGSHISFSRFDLSDLLQWSRFACANQGYACSRDNRGYTFLSAGDLHQNGQTSSLCNGFSPDWRGANPTGWKFNGEGMAHPFHHSNCRIHTGSHQSFQRFVDVPSGHVPRWHSAERAQAVPSGHVPSRHPSAERALVGKLAPCRAGTVEVQCRAGT